MIAALGLLSPTATRAQSVAWGNVSGTVVNAAGQPVARALVTISEGGGSRGREATTDLSGRFAFSLLSPGTYELRAEALGFQPVVARGLTLMGGESPSIALRLNPAAPPVVTVDTIEIATAASMRWRPGGVLLERRDVSELPDRYDDLASVTELSSSWDPYQGALGLPSSMTVVVADGVPFRRAAHPLARSEYLGDAIFPRSALAAATVSDGAPDVEWSGAGGYVALATPSGTTSGATSLSAAWSGKPLWSSSELDVDPPSLMSIRGSGAASFAVGNNTSVFLGADALQDEAPLAPRVDDTVAPTLAGVDPTLIATLSSPGRDRASRYSVVARADVQQSETTRFFGRALVAYSLREFEGPGPAILARDAAMPEESLDFSFASGLVWSNRPGLDFELRAGVSRSSRTFDPANAGFPAAMLAGSAATLGILSAGTGESSRTDFFLLPAAHFAVGGGQLKAGGTLRASAHEAEHDVPLELAYSDGPGLVAGRGFARALAAPSASYKTREVGAFARYDIQATPAVRVSVGARFDQERLPQSDVAQNTDWLDASGLANDTFPSKLNQFGMVGSLTWVPSPGGATRITSLVALQHGDVDSRAISELVSQDVGATSTRYAGTGLDWPGGSIPGSATPLPTLTLVGPDTRAPRSLLTSFGLSRRLATSWSARIEGSFRRTDFLMRRRNLNVPESPLATDPYGRDVFGTLQQDGSLVTATANDARRFIAFQEVWALDPDGWSEYRGVTFALDHSGPSRRFYASYTLSETTDNWIGASRGSPEAELDPLLPAAAGEWSEGTSDYDARHRVSAIASLGFGATTLSAAYRFRSGLPFTPGYRYGVDANGDGSFSNDVAFVEAGQVDPLLDSWPCLNDQVGGFAVRNSCRGPAEHAVDLRLSINVSSLGGRSVRLILDALDVIESKDGVIDSALLLVDPAGTITTSPGSVAIPLMLNPDFGRVIYPSTRGRQLRIGFRIGG